MERYEALVVVSILEFGMIYSTLNMNRNRNNGYKMAYQKGYKLKGQKKHMSTITAMLVYKQTMLPYLEYCYFLMDSYCKRKKPNCRNYSIKHRIVHNTQNIREVELKVRKK